MFVVNDVLDVYFKKKFQMELLFLLSSNNNEINCIDKFIGDDNCNLLCNQILSNNSIYSNINSLILRGNCLGLFYFSIF